MPAATSWKSLAEKADELERDGLVEEAKTYLLDAYENGARQPEVLWRTCRALYRAGQETTKPDVQAPLMEKALSLCDEAVKAMPESADTQLWMGIVLGKQNVSTKQRIANANRVREHFAKSLESRPHDPLALHSMGVWCYNVMGVSWAERKVAAMIFGEPPSCTPEECLKSLLHASKEGDTILNATLVGDVYANFKKDKVTAKQWYHRAMSMPTNTAAKARAREEAERKFKSL